MQNSLLKLTREIDPVLSLVYRAIHESATMLGLDYLVVGASARDLVMSYCYDLKIVRMTKDVDFGISVPDWRTYDALREELLRKDYKATNLSYRLVGPNHIPIDIVPFGALQDQYSQIALPPKGDFIMSVLGFEEAYKHADHVLVNENPEVIIPVASPIGLVLLKLVAWLDRDVSLRKKDAIDIKFICEKYEGLPGVLERVYDQLIDELESYDHNTELLAIHLLASEVAAIASTDTRIYILKLFQNAEMEKERRNFREQLGSDEIYEALSRGFCGE